jgi:DNA replication protein DnaC
LFFDMVDRRYNKEGAFNMIFTSNKNPSDWREIFGENDALLCSLDRLFDSASVFTFRGESFRGKHLENYTLRAEHSASTTQDNPLNH